MPSIAIGKKNHHSGSRRSSQRMLYEAPAKLPVANER